MKNLIVFLLLSVFACCCLSQKTTWDKLDNYTWEMYKQEFSKSYHPSEDKMRRSLFEARLNKIRKHNADTTKTWKEGVNHLTDRTEKERNAMRGFSKSIAKRWAHNREEGYNYVKPQEVKLPDNVDWRSKNIMSSVKDQGMCGSCWTFATSEGIESYYALKYGSGLVTDLSQQQILDCVPNPNDCGGTGGCEGGTPEIIYSAIMKTGITTEWMYSYVSYYGENFPTCRFNTTEPYAFVKNFTKLPTNNYDAVMQALATTGPLVINVAAGAWQDYESGIYNGCPQTNVDIDHVVLLVGYGVDASGNNYWIVRNSWSPKWGEQGYIRLFRHTTSFCGIDYNPSDGTGCNGGPSQVQVCGSCGLLYDVSYPIIQ